MKRFLSLILAMCMVVSLCACGSKSTPAPKATAPAESAKEASTTSNNGKVSTDSANSEKKPDPTPEPKSNDDDVDNAAWDQLESLGKIETENGLFYVNITLPADFVGDDVTQEKIDAEAGEHYTSGKLNEDGSVTYKMTKKQHKAMLDSVTESIESSLQEMVNSPDNAFTEITHNSDFTSFDAYLSTESLGLTESIMVLGFYMFGGMYSIFTGNSADNISVNFYSASGNLINTANSNAMG